MFSSTPPDSPAIRRAEREWRDRPHITYCNTWATRGENLTLGGILIVHGGVKNKRTWSFTCVLPPLYSSSNSLVILIMLPVVDYLLNAETMPPSGRITTLLLYCIVLYCIVLYCIVCVLTVTARLQNNTKYKCFL